MPPTWRRKKTAAASVGAMMAPSSSPSIHGKPKRTSAASATSTAVKTTPTVARTSDGAAAMRSVESARLEAGIEQDEGERDGADEIGGAGIVEDDAADAVLAGEQPDEKEDEEQRGAEAEADEAGEDRRDHQRRTDENCDIHQFEHCAPASGLFPLLSQHAGRSAADQRFRAPA